MNEPLIYTCYDVTWHGFTCWVVKNGHAWPFDSAQTALANLPELDLEDHPFVHADYEFACEVADPNYRWDCEPSADDGEDVARLLES